MDPIFIIGTERTGTNLLRLILNSHSHISIPHPPHIMKNFAGLEPFYGDLSVEKNFRALIRDVVTTVRLHAYPWGISLDQEKIFLKAKARDLISVCFAVYDQYLESSGKSRWGCKSTFMIYHVALLRKYYPAAKFIYMVRDGRDVAASAKKTIFNHYCVYFTAKLWALEQEIGIYWLNKLSGQEIILLRYEDLLRDPEATVRSLCKFLDEPYQDNMLDFFKSKEAQKSASLSYAWKNTASPILKDNSAKFTKELSKKEIDLFEAIAFRELDRFSYALSKPFCLVESVNARGVKFKLSYLAQEVFLMACVQLQHIFTDRNTLIRFKKFLFLQYLNFIRPLKWN